VSHLEAIQILLGLHLHFDRLKWAVDQGLDGARGRPCCPWSRPERGQRVGWSIGGKKAGFAVHHPLKHDPSFTCRIKG
jgi:hypothetical protein